MGQPARHQRIKRRFIESPQIHSCIQLLQQQLIQLVMLLRVFVQIRAFVLSQNCLFCTESALQNSSESSGQAEILTERMGSGMIA